MVDGIGPMKKSANVNPQPAATEAGKTEKKEAPPAAKEGLAAASKDEVVKAGSHAGSAITSGPDQIKPQVPAAPGTTVGPFSRSVPDQGQAQAAPTPPTPPGEPETASAAGGRAMRPTGAEQAGSSAMPEEEAPPGMPRGTQAQSQSPALDPAKLRQGQAGHEAEEEEEAPQALPIGHEAQSPALDRAKARPGQAAIGPEEEEGGEPSTLLAANPAASSQVDASRIPGQQARQAAEEEEELQTLPRGHEAQRAAVGGGGSPVSSQIDPSHMRGGQAGSEGLEEEAEALPREQVALSPSVGPDGPGVSGPEEPDFRQAQGQRPETRAGGELENEPPPERPPRPEE